MNKKLFIGLLVFFIIGLVIAAFFDLELSKSVVNMKNAFCLFLAQYSEAVGCLALGIGFIMLNTSLEISNRILYCLCFAFNFIAGSGLFYNTIYRCFLKESEFFKGIPKDKEKIITIIFAVLIVIILTMVFKYIVSSSFKARHKAFSRLGVYWGSAILAIVHTIKPIWGRVRFRDLDSDYSLFHVWYYPQQAIIHDKMGKSFPSGHTTAAWLALIILFLFQYKSKRTQNIVMALIIFWGCLVGSSRIVVGAHYLSDVLVASMISILSFVSIYHYRDKYILSN